MKDTKGNYSLLISDKEINVAFTLPSKSGGKRNGKKGAHNHSRKQRRAEERTQQKARKKEKAWRNFY